MALNAAGANASASGFTAVALYISLHSAAPDASGSNATTHSRVTANWTAPSTGSVSIGSAKNFTGGVASGAVTWVGYWSAATGGTYYGSDQISTAAGNDLASNAAGAYTLQTLTRTFT